MPMGSPISPIVADIVMENILDEMMVKTCNKPRFLTKYVDDIFAIVKSNDVESILTILNNVHFRIKFTIEEELNDKLPYLDTTVIRHDNRIKLKWYQKPTNSGRYINFDSQHHYHVVRNTALNLIRHVFNISDSIFHKENEETIIGILTKNNFLINIIKSLLKKAKSTESKKSENEPKIYVSMTYIPSFSESFQKSKCFNKTTHKVAFKTTNTLKNWFNRTKTPVDKLDQHNLVYKIPCEGDGANVCQQVYVGTTKKILRTRIAGHKHDLKSRTTPLDQKTALATHCIKMNHSLNFDEVTILHQEKNYKRRMLLEMLHIIDVLDDQQLNYKRNTEGLAQIYRSLIKN
ncbi:uncharacterized protein LOC119666350 [Teleopsis dalmanni]|uniref:uncharacterized protein LOC119666350 n=1 Tax=Teleopsis dalmanni TaxID=139649 RepID=UPI0018CDA65E|nr:uncharacterized protein LOC119666350 [Teleopsis dalmanni]